MHFFKYKGTGNDFILIDKDYFKAPVNELYDITVLQTWIAGMKRYEKDKIN
jgi:diaminopimelate epimerase